MTTAGKAFSASNDTVRKPGAECLSRCTSHVRNHEQSLSWAEKETWVHFRKEEESSTNPVLAGVFPQYRSEPDIVHKIGLYSTKNKMPYSIVASNEEVEEAKKSLGEFEGEMTPAESAGWLDLGAATPTGGGAASALGGP